MKNILLAACLLLAATYLQAQQIAFPGTEGYGKYTTGGCGRRVLTVTNLNDSGEGSFREAVEQKGPRIVVFAVDGTIELKSPLRIINDSITIAGQSAPGDGICLKDYPLIVDGSNVIVRYLRVRVGDRHRLDSDGLGGGRYGQKNVILDHLSVSWSIGECLSIYKTENLTVQWCLVAHSLNTSVHTKGSHGFGASGADIKQRSTTICWQTMPAVIPASRRWTVRNGWTTATMWCTTGASRRLMAADIMAR